MHHSPLNQSSLNGSPMNQSPMNEVTLFMPISQPSDGYATECLPSEEDFNSILNEYISSLSPKKRDKALIPTKRYENIRAVLLDPKCTTIVSAAVLGQ